MNNLLLKCKNITYEVSEENIFGKTRKVILENISFEIYRNEILSIAGESGSGKTTLGKIISGISEPTKGNIEFYFQPNHSNKRISPAQILFQNNNELINPYRTVESILSEAINKAGDNAIVNSVDELLKLFSLPDSIKKQKGYTLSGGQQQRVAFARILAVNPQLIILDEPFSAQDSSSVENLISIINKIRNSFNNSIVCISHDIKILKNISDRILIMKDGKIVEAGDAQQIFSNPANEYTHFLIKASELELSADEVKTFLKKYEQDQRNKDS
jgi:ABC-type glutathione transport system ATPase component